MDKPGLDTFVVLNMWPCDGRLFRPFRCSSTSASYPTETAPHHPSVKLKSASPSRTRSADREPDSKDRLAVLETRLEVLPRTSPVQEGSDSYLLRREGAKAVSALACTRDKRATVAIWVLQPRFTAQHSIYHPVNFVVNVNIIRQR